MSNSSVLPAIVEDGRAGVFYFSIIELIAGAVAGFAEHVIMFPFDTIKTSIQSGRTTGMRDSFAYMWKGEKLAHMYRGCVPILFSALPAHAAYFGVYEAFKRITGNSNIAVGVSASMATMAHDAVSTPFDVIKQRMQMDRARQFKSSFGCGKHILQHEGLHAMYVSLPTTVLMNVPHSATYWLVYETFFSIFHNRQKPEEDSITLDYLAAGFLAGAGAAVVSFPMDTIKTQLQLGKGHSFFQTFNNLLHTRGVRGIFAGVIPRILYTAPSGALMMVTYQTTRDLLISEETVARMSGSFALRKLLYANIDNKDVPKPAYHFSGSYEPLLGSVSIFQSSAILPRSGLRFASFCFGACSIGCLVMKTRNKEKWWFGLFLLAAFYYNAVKAHKVKNGLVGHQCGFFAAAMGTIGCTGRLLLRSGTARSNRRLLGIFMGLMWYEIGRYHLWAEHVTEFKRDVRPERYYNLFSEYVPENVEIEFIPYRSVSSY